MDCLFFGLLIILVVVWLGLGSVFEKLFKWLMVENVDWFFFYNMCFFERGINLYICGLVIWSCVSGIFCIMLL